MPPMVTDGVICRSRPGGVSWPALSIDPGRYDGVRLRSVEKQDLVGWANGVERGVDGIPVI